MSKSATIVYNGNLCCEIKKFDTKETIYETNASGAPQTFSPTDALASALAACTASMIGYVASQRNLNVQGLEVEVSKEMGEAPARVKSFSLTVKFPKASVPEEEKARLEAAAKACPVKNTLHPETEVKLEFIY